MSEAYEYGVFQDANRHTCIMISEIRGKVQYVPMTSGDLELLTMSSREFHTEFKRMPDYPVKRAAEYYLSIATSLSAGSSKVREHLGRIVADPSLEYDRSLFNPIPKPQPRKDIIMATKGTKAPAKAAAKKTEGGKKPSLASKAASKAPVSNETEAGVPRVSKYAGKDITVIGENPAREGTIRHAIIAAIMKAKNTDKVLGTDVSNADGSKTETIAPGHVSWCVSNGVIELAE